MFSFKRTTTVLTAVPTQCGKMYVCISVLKRKLILPEPQRIVQVYGEWQNAYAGLQQELPHVEFAKNFQPQLHLSFDSSVRNLLLVDDQMENRNARKRGAHSLLEFITQGTPQHDSAVHRAEPFQSGNSMRAVLSECVLHHSVQESARRSSKFRQ